MELIKLFETGRLYSQVIKKYVPKSYIVKAILENREFKIIKELSNEDVTHHYKNVYGQVPVGVELIKKYENRKLYSTLRNRYMTLGDVDLLIKQGKQFKVMCARTFKDLTDETILKANYASRLDQIKQQQVGI
jgi:polyhydroxyalkanoate synthesis regulator protein